MQKASIVGELLLLVGLLAVAYLVYVQQEQLASVELELDRVRGALGAYSPVPAASDNGAVEVEPKPKAAPRARKGSGAPGA